MSLKSFKFALLGCLALATSAPAATVTYILDTETVPGSFSLYASVSSGDNLGLAFYGVPLTGTVTNLNNMSPLAVNGANFAPVGFDQLRSPAAGASDPAAGPLVNPEVIGGQNVIGGPPANLITGFGQEAGSWASKGIATLGFPDSTTDIAWGATPVIGQLGTYNNPIRLATGNFTGSLSINASSLNLAANAWASVDNRDAPAATIVLDTVGGVPINTPPTVVPPAPNAGVTAGQVLVGDFNATDTEDPAGPFTFSGLNLASFVASHGGTNPAGLFTTAASLNTSTGEVTWDTTGFARGTYLVEATVADPDGATAVAPGQWSVTITAVPEPSTLALCGLALVGSLGMVRRRNG